MDRKRKRKYGRSGKAGAMLANSRFTGELRELNSRAWDGEKGQWT